MKHLAVLSLVVIVSLFAWSVASFAAAPTPTPAAPAGGQGSTVVTGSNQQQAAPRGTPGVSQSPAGVTVKPTAMAPSGPIPTTVAPTSALTPEGIYDLQEERVIGPYAVRLWKNVAPDSIGDDSVATISAVGQGTVQVETVARFNDLTGTDITGDGNPDVVLDRFTGGAHCCFSTVVYDLGPTLTKIMETKESNCGGEFKDLDQDGVMEYMTCDDLFAYKYCCYAGSALVRVILKYYPGQGYLPASTHFRQLYAEDIVAHTQRASEGAPGDQCETDSTNKCSVLPLVLDYLYSAQHDKAWEAIRKYYPYSDAEAWQNEITEAVSASPLFVFP